MSALRGDDTGYTSPTSPADGDASSDPGYQSPEPDGSRDKPFRWFGAGESSTRIAPFSETQDASVEWFFKPATLTVLAAAMGVLAYIAMSRDVLDEGHDKQWLGVWAALSGFLLFSMIQFRDGPFVRPHPAFWRVVLGLNLIYELALVFLLFQDLGTARQMMKILDPSLGVPLPEKSYAEDCRFTFVNLWNAIDIFCLAHALGWYGKALILRDYWFCWILSIAFEFAEYSLQHQLPNFAECWWDHWILDVLVCNWLGLWLGMKTCEYLQVKPFTWRGTPRGVRARTRRVLKQFAPHDFTAFKWEGTADFAHYTAVFFLLAVFLAAELSPFYLKSLLWMEPEHPFVIARLAGVFVCALPAVRELYQYIAETKQRATVRMGQHAWLLIATVATELLVIFKWSRGMYPEPFPTHVKLGLSALVAAIVAYPAVTFGMGRSWRDHRRVPGKRRPVSANAEKRG